MAFFDAEGLQGLLLLLQHGQIGIGGIEALVPAGLDALEQQGWRGLQIKDQQRHLSGGGHRRHPLAIALAQESGIHDHRQSGGENRRRLGR